MFELRSSHEEVTDGKLLVTRLRAAFGGPVGN